MIHIKYIAVVIFLQLLLQQTLLFGINSSFDDDDPNYNLNFKELYLEYNNLIKNTKIKTSSKIFIPDTLSIKYSVHYLKGNIKLPSKYIVDRDLQKKEILIHKSSLWLNIEKNHILLIDTILPIKLIMKKALLDDSSLVKYGYISDIYELEEISDKFFFKIYCNISIPMTDLGIGVIICIDNKKDISIDIL